jgi:hypothetical protein
MSELYKRVLTDITLAAMEKFYRFLYWAPFLNSKLGPFKCKM